MTFKLYHAHGSCSLVSHIALEESGARYTTQLVDLAGSEQHSAAYRAINPRGRVPTLQLEDGSLLTENVAILYFIGTRFPDAGLLPADPALAAKALSIAAFFASSVHVAHRHIRQPRLYTSDESAYASIQAVGKRTFHDYLKEVDGLLRDRPWFLDQFTIADPYALIFYYCGIRLELPVHELQAYTAHTRRLTQRPAIRRVLDQDPQVGPALRQHLL